MNLESVGEQLHSRKPDHRTSSVYLITDLRQDGPLGWWCDYVWRLINPDVFTHAFGSSNTR